MRNVLFVSLIAAAVAGCATLQTAQARSTGDVLSAAGFSIERADTADKIADLQTPPARQLVPEVRGGTPVYVYRDPSACRCLYVGGEPQYQEYKRLQVTKDIAGMQERGDMTSTWGWSGGWDPWGIVGPGTYWP